MPRSDSHGRHGGNHSPADNGDDRDPNTRASRNTDVESLANDRNDNRAGGREIGKR